MNQSRDEVRAWSNELDLDCVQLHGDEQTVQWLSLGRRLIKRVHPGGPPPELAGALPLLDPGAGSGAAWDWHAIGARGRGCILAGGLNPENVAAAIAAVGPLGVDVSSGVECTPGRKSTQRMGEFVERARTALARASR